LAPVQVVQLEDAIGDGPIGIGPSHCIRFEGTLPLGDASPLGQLVTRHSQLGHFLGQGASIHLSSQDN